jgi:hypothetical protein
MRALGDVLAEESAGVQALVPVVSQISGCRLVIMPINFIQNDSRGYIQQVLLLRSLNLERRAGTTISFQVFLTLEALKD